MALRAASSLQESDTTATGVLQSEMRFRSWQGLVPWCGWRRGTGRCLLRTFAILSGLPLVEVLLAGPPEEDGLMEEERFGEELEESSALLD
jgi:hypothetical protein